MAPSAVEAVTLPTFMGKSAPEPTEKLDEIKLKELFRKMQTKTWDAHPKTGPILNHRAPMKYSGLLDKFEKIELTPIIGREYVNVNLVDLLEAPNSDDLLRDLAITVSQRGVVVFRGQGNMTTEQQQYLIQRMGQLTGKPKESALYIHPLSDANRNYGGTDRRANVVSSKMARQLQVGVGGWFVGNSNKDRQTSMMHWHSDEAYEKVPGDYSALRITGPLTTGGDTVFASGCEVYDRLSPTLRDFLSTLTCYCQGTSTKDAGEEKNIEWYPYARGHPENIGDVLEAVHPVIRTNPVTGWNSLFAFGQYVRHIHGLSELESERMIQWLSSVVVENHDLQCRVKWNQDDVALWDNRSIYHAATIDYIYEPTLGDRSGVRVTGMGEKPYFDPNGLSRREDLGGYFA